MSAAWWRKSRGSRTGGGKDPARAFAASLVAPKGALHGVVAALARMNQLSAGEAEALNADVRRRVAANDFQLLRELYGSSSLLTALLVVVQRCATAHREELWTHWRADAAAAGHGDLAGTLERLVYDEALSFEEALEITMAGHGTEERARAAALWEKRPWRGATRPILDLKWERLETGPPPETFLREPTDLERHLSAALHTLAPEDWLLLHQRFAGRLPIEAIGRVRQSASSGDVAQQLDVALAQLARELARAGIDVPDLEAALADPRPGYRRKTTES